MPRRRPATHCWEETGERACCCCKHGGPTPNGNTCGWGLLERPQVPLGVSVPRPVSPDLPFPVPHLCPLLSGSRCPSTGSPTLQHQVGRARRLNLGACPLLTRPCPFLPSLMRPHFLWQEPPPSPGLGKKEPPGRSRRQVPGGSSGGGGGGGGSSLLSALSPNPCTSVCLIPGTGTGRQGPGESQQHQASGVKLAG